MSTFEDANYKEFIQVGSPDGPVYIRKAMVFKIIPHFDGDGIPENVEEAKRRFQYFELITSDGSSYTTGEIGLAQFELEPPMYNSFFIANMTQIGFRFDDADAEREFWKTRPK